MKKKYSRNLHNFLLSTVLMFLYVETYSMQRLNFCSFSLLVIPLFFITFRSYELVIFCHVKFKIVVV